MPFDINTTDAEIIEALGGGAAGKTCKPQHPPLSNLS
jgi:hypothetical protein